MKLPQIHIIKYTLDDLKTFENIKEQSILDFLPYLVNFKQNLPINLYLVYILYLLNSAVTYFVPAYKQALLMANQEQYKIESINIIFVVVNCIADVFVLIVFKQYMMYLLAKLILAIEDGGTRVIHYTPEDWEEPVC